MSAHLEALSTLLRNEIIFSSGGWLADIVPRISDALGVWDILILCGLFIASWVILRISDPLTSLILGCAFDVTIPLQHQLNPNLQASHKSHLDGYWPIQMFAAGLEALSFFMVAPELFTLVVCLKTLIMTAVWLGRRSDGSFLTERKTSSSGSSAARQGSLNGRRTGTQGAEPTRFDGTRSDRRERSDANARRGDPSQTPSDKDKNQTDRADRKSSRRTNNAPSGDDQVTNENNAGASDKGRKVKVPESMPPSGEVDQSGFAPPGLGPPITKEDADIQIAEREARRKARGYRPVNEKVIRLGNDPSESDRYLGRSNEISNGPTAPLGADRWTRASEAEPRPMPVPPAKEKRGLRQRLFGRSKPTQPVESYEAVPIPPAYRADGSRVPEAPATPVEHVLPEYEPYSWINQENFRAPLEFTPAEGGPSRLLSQEEKSNLASTALWEAVGDIDSLDYLTAILKIMGFDTVYIAWMIMDLLNEFSPEGANRTITVWDHAYRERDVLLMDLEPYSIRLGDSLAWRPHPDNIWWHGKSLVGQEDAKLVGRDGLDHFVWDLRAAGVAPPTRHAIIKELMSTGDYRKYKQIMQDALSDTKPLLMKRSSNIENLNKRYHAMNKFGMRYNAHGRAMGPYWCMSEDEQRREFEAQLEAGRSIDVASRNVRWIRTVTVRRPVPGSDPQGQIEYYHEQDAALRRYGEDIEQVFTVRMRDLFPGSARRELN